MHPELIRTTEENRFEIADWPIRVNYHLYPASYQLALLVRLAEEIAFVESLGSIDHPIVVRRKPEKSGLRPDTIIGSKANLDQRM